MIHLDVSPQREKPHTEPVVVVFRDVFLVAKREKVAVYGAQGQIERFCELVDARTPFLLEGVYDR